MAVDSIPEGADSLPRDRGLGPVGELAPDDDSEGVRRDARVCAPSVVNDVFTNGRKAFEVGVTPTDVPRCRSSSPWPPSGWGTP
jgi:hypothetical protein